MLQCLDRGARRRWRRAPLVVRSLAAVTWLAAGCGDGGPTGVEPPFIAIVTRVDGDSTLGYARALHYRVREISGTLGIDRTIAASARDTIILPVKPATYTVELLDPPDTCGVREGTERAIVIPPNSNTGVIRYALSCQALLTVSTATDGPEPDSQYVVSVRSATAGGSVARVIGGNATLRINDLAPGDYTVALDLVDARCVVTSEGGDRVRLTIPPEGGASANFRVVCSDPARRPTLLSLGATHHDGILGLVFIATDPDRDIERFTWNVTDCAGRSLLPDGAQLRRGLGAGRTARQDTVTVLSALRTGLADSVAQRACVALRVADQYENSTPVVQRPLALTRGRPPAGTLNALFVGTQLVRAQLQATDADGDYLGVVVATIARDGALVQPPDGQPDVGLYNRPGYLGTAIPDLPFTTTFRWNDLYAIVTYLFDAAGNFSIVQDAELFR